MAGIEDTHRCRRGKKRSRLAAGAVAPDLVGRNFVADRPDQLWVADISFLHTCDAASVPPMLAESGYSYFEACSCCRADVQA